MASHCQRMVISGSCMHSLVSLVEGVSDRQIRIIRNSIEELYLSELPSPRLRAMHCTKQVQQRVCKVREPERQAASVMRQAFTTLSTGDDLAFCTGEALEACGKQSAAGRGALQAHPAASMCCQPPSPRWLAAFAANKTNQGRISSFLCLML